MSISLVICFLFLLTVAGLIVAAPESTHPVEPQDDADPGDTHGHTEPQSLPDDPASPMAWQAPDLPWTDELDSYSPTLDESDSHVGAFSGHDWGDRTGSDW